LRTFVGDEKRRPSSLRSASQNFKFQDCLALIAEALGDSAAVSFVRFHFFRVELHGEPARIAFGVARTLFTAESGEADEDLGLLARALEDLGFGPLRDIAGNLEKSVSARPFGADMSFQKSVRITPGALNEGAESSDGLTNDERVHLARALIGVQRLRVGEVAGHLVIKKNAVGTEQLTRPCHGFAHF